MVVENEFKQTEIGTIPFDWEVVKLSDFIRVARGGSPRPIQDYITQNPKGINWIKIGDTNSTSKYIISSEEKILKEGEYKSRKVYPGDFLLSNSMSFGRPYILKIEGCIHDGWLVLQDYKEYFDTDFLYYILSSSIVTTQYSSKAAGSSVLNLNKELVKSVKLVKPKSFKEQTAIANALSNIDELISQIEKLIDKKKAVKQGIMQELLKPKEGWVTKKLGDVFEIEKGTQLNRSTLDSSSEFPVYNGGIAPSGYTASFNTNENTIIISEGGNSCGYVNYIKTKFWRGGHCYEIRPNNYLNKHFAYFLLKYNEAEIMALRVGSGLPNIQRSNLAKYHINFPDLNEQKLISKILIDLQNSFDLSNVKLHKLKLQKQGMMQALLTGKIRLI